VRIQNLETETLKGRGGDGVSMFQIIMMIFGEAAAALYNLAFHTPAEL
jgi:hypothetical protein